MNPNNGGSDVPSQEIVDDLWDSMTGRQKDFWGRARAFTVYAISKGYTAASFDPCPGCLKDQGGGMYAGFTEWVHDSKLLLISTICEECAKRKLRSKAPSTIEGEWIATMMAYPLEASIWMIVVRPDGSVQKGDYIESEAHKGIIDDSKKRIRGKYAKGEN